MKTILLVIALVAKADAPKADLPTVAAATAAVTAVTVVGEVTPMTAAVPSAGGVLPAAASAAGCAPVDLFRGDAGFLSGPWCAARRLESARKRGDSAATRHLEATLDALLVEAVGGGEWRR